MIHWSREAVIILLKSFYQIMNKYRKLLKKYLWQIKQNPRFFRHMIKTFFYLLEGKTFSSNYKESFKNHNSRTAPEATNPLWNYFKNHHEGPGIYKWEHYFEIYHRHLAKFIGQKVDVLEIGIYSGGSLDLWRSYFGEHCNILGIDIEPACKVYERPGVSVIIGDQGNRKFWREFKENSDGIDILIDDGGHTVEQQKVTLEEMLSHIRPGGVYICEDIHGDYNRFASFASGLVNELNRTNFTKTTVLESQITQFQSSIQSIHFYPFLLVIEKHLLPRQQFMCSRQGTEWQPFL